MIRTRIAPSPTGLLHIGTLRTALFNYLFAKKHNGTFIVRVEDTDKERSKKDFETNILEGLENIGLKSDESPIVGGKYGPYRQSERTEIYKKYLLQLLEQGDAYYCYCSKEELDKEREKCMSNKLPPRYSGKCRNLNEEAKSLAREKKSSSVIRLKVPENTDIHFYDLIRGDQKQNTKDLTGDFVIAKDLETPLYNFTVAIDDTLMEITHVMRGEDHISNTPKQILIYKALGLNIPEFAHFPLILNQDKSKLSKRKNAVSVQDYLDKGYLKSSLINFLALLGWNPGTEQEIFDIEELIKLFSLDRIQKGGAVFDTDRLNWINTEHIKKMSDKDFITATIPFLKDNLNDKIDREKLNYLLLQERPRIKFFSDITENLKFFFNNNLNYEISLLCGKKLQADFVLNVLEEIEKVLNTDDKFTEESLRENLIVLIKKLELKNGEVLWPLRAALTGQDRSPGAFEVAYALGKERSVARVKYAIELLKKNL